MIPFAMWLVAVLSFLIKVTTVALKICGCAYSSSASGELWQKRIWILLQPFCYLRPVSIFHWTAQLERCSNEAVLWDRGALRYCTPVDNSHATSARDTPIDPPGTQLPSASMWRVAQLKTDKYFNVSASRRVWDRGFLTVKRTPLAEGHRYGPRANVARPH